MSERGSFVSNYTYCHKCIEVLKKHLLDRDKFLCSQVLMGEDGEEFPIIAGKIGGNYSGHESNEFWFDFGKKIAKEICHEVRIAVLCDTGSADEIFIIKPGQTDEVVLKKYQAPYNGEE